MHTENLDQNTPAAPAQTDTPLQPTPNPKPQPEESEWSDLEDEPRKPVLLLPDVGEEGPLGPLKTKNEIILKPFDKPESLEERQKRLGLHNLNGGLVKVGYISAIVEDRVIFESVDKLILELDNVLVSKDRLLVGSVEDVFGPIEKPQYSVLHDVYLREILGDGRIKIGDPVFCIGSEMRGIYEDKLEDLKSRKGCDASNKFDEEPLSQQQTEDLWFSDDEKEEMFQQRRPPGSFVGKRDPVSHRPAHKKHQDLPDLPSFRPPQQQAQPAPHFQASQSAAPLYVAQQPMQYHMPYAFQMPAVYPPATGLVAPMVPGHLGQLDQNSYSQYLAQINLMYGLPPNSPGPGLYPQAPPHSSDEQFN